jgi:hypothetical protein
MFLVKLTNNVRQFGMEYFIYLSPAQKHGRLKFTNPVIVPFILYGCGTWCVTLKEGYKLRHFRTGTSGEH